MPPDLIALAREHGFAAAYILDANLAADAPQGISTLLLMVYPYPSWGEAPAGCARISTYYNAAHAAYQKAKEMVDVLKSMEESAQLCNDVRLKPLLTLLNDSAQGRNSLHYHKLFGSRFHMQTIGLHKHYAIDESTFKKADHDMCGACQKCMKACPTNAITPDGFERAKCLRQYMMEGKPVPVEMRSKMGNSLLGCDICQQVCPYNSQLTKEVPAEDRYEIELLLKKDQALLSHLTMKIGKNMSIPNRILAQACLIAGNSGNQAYLPILEELCRHPSSAVAEHAAWSVRKLSIESMQTTI